MTDIQENVGVLVTYGAESAFGDGATAGGTSQRLRRMTASLNVQKDVFASAEARADQQMSDVRHGGQRVTGAIDGELSTQSYDDLFAALMRNTWAAGVALTESDFTSLAVSSGVITLGSGNPSTLGLRIGDYVDFTNMSVSGNNTRARITAMTSSTFTTYPLLADQGADTACNIAVVGKKLINGTAKSSFAIEQLYSTIDACELFSGCRFGGASLRLPPNGNASVSFEVMGQMGQLLTGSSSPYFTAPTDAVNTEILDGISGAVNLNDAEQTIVTGIDLQLSLNMNSAPVIGTPYVPDIFYGRTVLTGNLSFYLADETLLNLFLNETEFPLVVQASAPDGSFLAFSMQRCKLTGAQKQIPADGGVIIQSPFQALLKSAGTGYDATTLSIQRSNS